MKEVIVKYKSSKALEALKEFAKKFDITIEKKLPSKMADSKSLPTEVPITFSSEPDFTALQGVWSNRDINLNDLRDKAWGDKI